MDCLWDSTTTKNESTIGLNKMLIISSLDNYKISDIETFVTSLNKSGYKGEKCMIAYRCEDYVKTFLKNFGWNVIDKDSQGEYIVTKRFQHFAEVIDKGYKVSRVLVTDCRDVYFHQIIFRIPAVY